MRFLINSEKSQACVFRIAFNAVGRCIAIAASCGILAADEPNPRFASTSSSQPLNSASVRWPFEFEAGQFRIHSTLPERDLAPQVASIIALPVELHRELGIDVTSEAIHVVVLESREALDSYVRRMMPNAPSRRALYIRHRGPGLVLTYFHTAWINDVRHECTHALLDASNLRLPVWLDEGIAEYFETVGTNRALHASHLSAIRTQIRYGQVAELERLEQLDSNATLTAKDYRDSWSIVALMLNSSEDSRNAYCEYLKDMQLQRSAGFLSHRLPRHLNSWREEYIRFFKQ